MMYPKEVHIQYFANNPDIQKGMVLGISKSEYPIEVDLIYKTHGIPIGLSMQNIVSYNEMCTRMLGNDETTSGSKIGVMTNGEVLIKCDIDLPIRQPIYVDTRNATLTWKKLGPEVGYTTSTCLDGFVRVKVEF